MAVRQLRLQSFTPSPTCRPHEVSGRLGNCTRSGRGLYAFIELSSAATSRGIRQLFEYIIYKMLINLQSCNQTPNRIPVRSPRGRGLPRVNLFKMMVMAMVTAAVLSSARSASSPSCFWAVEHPPDRLARTQRCGAANRPWRRPSRCAHAHGQSIRTERASFQKSPKGNVKPLPCPVCRVVTKVARGQASSLLKVFTLLR